MRKREREKHKGEVESSGRKDEGEGKNKEEKAELRGAGEYERWSMHPQFHIGLDRLHAYQLR